MPLHPQYAHDLFATILEIMLYIYVVNVSPKLSNKQNICICRWAMKRMKLEFEEMLRSTTGKLLEHITVRDFNLGRTFPIIKNASVDNVSVNEDNVIEVRAHLLNF